jgi:cephalosporin-C deacetylase-like acetyl esterase
LKSLLFIIAGSYVGLCVLLYFAQHGLIFPAPQQAGKPVPPPGWVLETIPFKTHDGLPLTGWLVRPPEGKLPLLIYFGGNAEEVSWTAGFAERTPSHALLLVNYRGYGGHPGQVSEDALVADGIAVYDQAKALANIRSDRISIHGRSLGSGVAVGVAAARPVEKVVLTTPFDSLRAVAGNAYPFVPVSLLLRHPFDSVARAPRITAPVLMLVAERDQIMRPTQHEALAAAWKGRVRVQRFPTADHNDIPDTAGYWDTIAAFLNSPEISPP